MHFRPSNHWRSNLLRPRFFSAVAAGLVFGLLLVPSVLRAGCGDYVFVRDATGKLVRASSLMNADGSHRGGAACTGPHCQGHMGDALLSPTELSESAPQVPSAEKPLPIRVPCSGPECSGHPSTPLAPVPAPIQVRTQQDHAVLVVINDEQGETPCRDIFAAASLLEVHTPSAVFRPPR